MAATLLREEGGPDSHPRERLEFAAGLPRPPPSNGGPCEPSAARASARSSKRYGVVFGTSHRPVELVGAACRVEGVADRDLVADDEDHLPGAPDQRPESESVAPGGIVEALAAGKGVRARVRMFPLAVRGERLPLELAHVDVVQERLLDFRHIAPAEDLLGGLEGSAEAGVDAELERKVGQLIPEAPRRAAAFLGEPDVDARIAVHAPLAVERRVAVAGQDVESHLPSLGDSGAKGSA
jgi:hypothetical protein